MPIVTPGQRNLATISQAAAFYGVSQRTVRNWIANGNLTAYRIGPRLLRVDLARDAEAVLQPVLPTARQ